MVNSDFTVLKKMLERYEFAAFTIRNDKSLKVQKHKLLMKCKHLKKLLKEYDICSK